MVATGWLQSDTQTSTASFGLSSSALRPRRQIQASTLNSISDILSAGSGQD